MLLVDPLELWEARLELVLGVLLVEDPCSLEFLLAPLLVLPLLPVLDLPKYSREDRSMQLIVCSEMTVSYRLLLPGQNLLFFGLPVHLHILCPSFLVGVFRLLLVGVVRPLELGVVRLFLMGVLVLHVRDVSLARGCME